MQELNYNFINKIKSLPFVEAVYLFGSRVRGDNHKRSDIDLAVKLIGNNRNDWVQVMEIIDDADTLLEIDCVDLNNAGEDFSEIIQKEGKLIYERATQ